MKIYALFVFLAVPDARAQVRIPDEAAQALVVVNGTPVTRSEVQARAFRQCGTNALNELAEEILVRQAAEAAGVRADPKDVDARFQAVRARFGEEPAFQRQLAAAGTSPAELRALLERQVLRETLTAKSRRLSVDEREVREYFEANKAKLGAPESARVRALLVATEKEASDFLVALRAGADFAALAAQVSLDAATKARGGDMGLMARGMLQDEIDKKVFAAAPGEFVGPLKVQAGFALFKVEELRPAKAADFKDVRADLRRALLADKLAKAWPGLLEELRSKAKFETGAPLPARSP